MFCLRCQERLESYEFDFCTQCSYQVAGDEDARDEYFQNRFDMETEAEYQKRRENKW